MTTYTLSSAQAPNARTATVSGEMTTLHARFTLSQVLAAGDIVELFRIPSGARIRNWMVFSQQLDTNGTPTLAFNLGDKTSPTRIAAAATVGRAGGPLECAVGAVPKGYQYLADDTAILTVTTAAATQAAGAYVDIYLDTYQG